MKQVQVQDGLFKGKMAVILGTDFEHFGKSVMAINDAIGRNYAVRWAHNKDWNISDKVYIANIDGQLVALNQKEIAKPKKAKATKATESKAEPKTEKKGSEEK